MIKRIVSVGLIALIACIGIVAPVSATTSTLYENFTTGGNSDSSHIYGTNFVAEQFTAIDSHTISKIALELKRVGSPGTVVVELRDVDSVSGDISTIDLLSYSMNGNLFPTGYTLLSYTVGGTTDAIINGNEYALVVSAPSGDSSNYIMWQGNSAGGLANAVGLHNTDSGFSAWVSDTPADYLLSLWQYNFKYSIGASYKKLP